MIFDEIPTNNGFLNDHRTQTILSVIKNIFEIKNPSDLVSESLNKIEFKPSDTAIFSLGKASISMANGVLKSKFEKSKLKICLSPIGIEGSAEDFLNFKGNHPIPMCDSFESSEHILEILMKNDCDNLVVLLSGGASALFEIPEAGISRTEISNTTLWLLNNGTDIETFNRIRCSLSSIKCGKILNYLHFKKYYLIMISDVPSDKTYLIGSNPFINHKFGKNDIKSEKDETLQMNTFSIHSEIDTPYVREDLILSGKIFIDSIIHIFSQMGLPSINLGNILNGDVETIAGQISSKLREIFIEKKRPFWFAGYGETTTKVIGKGHGGRNLELSLRVMIKMNPEEIFSFFSIATDGDDGNSLMMGMITDDILKERTANVDLEKYLENSDSATFAEEFGVAVRTGYTGSNVSDIIIGYYGGLIENVNREE
ncbi:MAG: DUF4147 domain-containing protein [Thermoplasmataceae archaeon]